MFRDNGRSKGGFHFIIDYTILNGKKEPFLLNSLFSLTYKILDVKSGKNFYTFNMKILLKEKEAVEILKEPAKLINDSDWHSLAIPIPKPYAGKALKHYTLLFEDDISEIVFTNIYFV